MMGDPPERETSSHPVECRKRWVRARAGFNGTPEAEHRFAREGHNSQARARKVIQLQLVILTGKGCCTGDKRSRDKDIAPGFGKIKVALRNEGDLGSPIPPVCETAVPNAIASRSTPGKPCQLGRKRAGQQACHQKGNSLQFKLGHPCLVSVVGK